MANYRSSDAPIDHFQGSRAVFVPLPGLERRNSRLTFLRAFFGIARWLLAMRSARRLFALALVATVLWFAGPLYRGLSNDPLTYIEEPQRVELRDYAGSLYMRLGMPYEPVEWFEPEPLVVKAFIAAEDHRFYKHFGVSLMGLCRAVIRNAIASCRERKPVLVEGGSTITQQLVGLDERLTGGTGTTRLRNKVEETLIALRLEWALRVRYGRIRAKRMILIHYLNKVPLGHGIDGVCAASRYYFRRDWKKLTPGQAALIAGLPPGPSLNSPYNDPAKARAARDRVKGRLLETGMITEQEYKRWNWDFFVDSRRPSLRRGDGYVAAAVERELDSLTRNGEITAQDRARLDLVIYLSLDFSLHDVVEKTARSQCRRIERQPGYRHPTKSEYRSEAEPGYLQIAAVVIDNATGAILTTFGGRDGGHYQFDLALAARRPAASTWKPFLYAQLFEKGVSCAAEWSNAPLVPGEIPGAGDWSPQETSALPHGEHSLLDALAASSNITAVRVGSQVGREAICAFARRTGLSEIFPEGPSMFLGSAPVTLARLTAAYSIFPRGGEFIAPWMIRRIETRGGQVLFKRKIQPERLLARRTCHEVTKCLQAVLLRGTGRRAVSFARRVDVAGKTGTSEDGQDLRFVGYSSDITVGVWIGFIQPTPVCNGASGGSLALPVWLKIIESLPNRYKFRSFL